LVKNWTTCTQNQLTVYPGFRNLDALLTEISNEAVRMSGNGQIQTFYDLAAAANFYDEWLMLSRGRLSFHQKKLKKRREDWEHGLDVIEGKLRRIDYAVSIGEIPEENWVNEIEREIRSQGLWKYVPLQLRAQIDNAWVMKRIFGTEYKPSEDAERKAS